MTRHACACFNIQTHTCTHTDTQSTGCLFINGCVFSGVLVSWAHTPTHMLTQSTHTLETDTHTHTHSNSIVVVQGAVSSSSNLFVCFFLFSPERFPVWQPFPPALPLHHSNNYACHSFMCMHTDAHAPTHSALFQRLSLSAGCSVDCSAACSAA